MTDPAMLSATAIAAHVASRRLSAVEVTTACLARIEKLNPAVNAVCTLNPDALEIAHAVDQRLAAGEPPRLLEGVPVLVKDNLETKGLRTTFGSRLMEHHVPAEDCIAVARLRAAGAVLLGKTNTPEFAADVHTANPVFGTTRNPWNLMVTAGGSSGGSGAAVAAAFAPLALGTDLGGSVRIPASFNGLVGIRPAPGRIPVYPAEFAWDTLVPHLVGPLTATVEDAALMLAAMIGPDDRDPSSLPIQQLDVIAAASGRASLAGRRVAWCADLGGVVPLDDDVKTLAEAAARGFESLGCHVEEIAFDASDLVEIIGGTRSFGMAGRFAERYAAHKDLMTAPFRSQVEAALAADVQGIVRAERLRGRYWHRINAVMSRFDYIIAPSCGAPPFRLDAPLPTQVGGRAVARFYDVFLATYGFSITGLPVAAVPCGLTRDGLPVGIQIVTRRLREDLAFEAASAYQATFPEHFRRPRVDPSEAKPIITPLPMPGMMMSTR